MAPEAQSTLLRQHGVSESSSKLHEDTMNKLKALYDKFRSLKGYQQDAAFFAAGFLLGALVF